MRMKKIFSRLLLVLALSLVSVQSYAASKATNIEFLLSQVRNSVGNLAGGTVTVAAAGDATSTPITIWLDRNKATPAANPYTLDANGTAQLYADGLIKVVLKNAAGTTVYTRDNLNYVDFQTSGAYQALDSDYASLNAAITAIGSTPTTLLIRTASFPMTGAAVVPATLSIKIEYPGSIANSTYALTLNGPISFPNTQVFTGTGTVTINKTSASTLYTVWWGDLGNGTHNDTTAIWAALSCAIANGNGKVVTLNGNHMIDPDIIDLTLAQKLIWTGESASSNWGTATKGTSLTARSSGTTLIKMSDVSPAPAHYAVDSHLGHMRIDGAGLVENCVTASGDTKFDDLQLTGATVSGMTLEDLTNGTVLNQVTSTYNTGHGLLVKGPNTTVYGGQDNMFSWNDTWGVEIRSGAKAHFIRTRIEANVSGGLKINYINADSPILDQIIFDTLHVETNGYTNATRAVVAANYQIYITSDGASYVYAPKSLVFNSPSFGLTGVQKAVYANKVLGCLFNNYEYIYDAADVDVAATTVGVRFVSSDASAGFAIPNASVSNGFRSMTLWYSLPTIAAGATALMNCAAVDGLNTYPMLYSGYLSGLVLTKQSSTGVTAGTITCTPGVATKDTDAFGTFGVATALVLTASSATYASVNYAANIYPFDVSTTYKLLQLSCTASADYVAGANPKIMAGLTIEY